MTEFLTSILLHEKCLLGALIMAKSTRDGLTLLDSILPAGSITPMHAPAIEAIRAIAARGKEADLVAVAAELGARDELDRYGGANGVMAWVEGCPDPINGLEKYARSILEYRNRHQAQDLATVISNKIRKGDADGLQEDVSKLAEVTQGDGFRGPRGADWKSSTQSEIVPLPSLANLIDVEVDYLLDPILIRGCLTQLHGAPKGGKSVFSLYVALSVAIGAWKGKLWHNPTEEPRNVLYISFEDSPLLILKRAYRYLNGMGFDGHTLPSNFYLCDNPSLFVDTNTGNQLLREKIKELKIELVVIDTLSYVHQAEDENSSADVKPLMSNLKRIVRDLAISILYIHHSRKGDGTGSETASVERARGSSVISAAADIILDWGNRNGTNATPVRLISKYDEGYDFKAVYAADAAAEAITFTMIRDDIDQSGNVKPKILSTKENAEAVLSALKTIALQGCIQVPGADVTKIMDAQGMTKKTASRALALLVEEQRVSATPLGKGKTTVYEVIQSAPVVPP